MLTNQAQIANNMLKLQIDNAQREKDYYMQQMEVVKEQL